MTWRISITTKMLSIVGLTFVAIALIVSVSLVAFSRFTFTVQNIYEHGVVDMSAVSRVALDVEVQRGLAGRVPSELNLEVQEKYRADFIARSAAIDQNLASLRKAGLDPEQERLLNELQTASAAFREEAEHVFTLASSFAQDEAVKLLQGRFAAADAQVGHVLDQVVMHTSAAARARVLSIDTSSRHTRTTLLAIGAGLVVVIISLTLVIARSITTTLRTSITAVTTIAAQLAATVDQHEHTAVLQSSAVSETTATMDELEASFQHSAEQADVAATRARHALTLTEEGTGAVTHTLGGMVSLKGKVAAVAEQILRLSEQTSQIGHITNLVSELANQTNLLALNAAVEAARAGEHGKGFAVVATEIRKLADQSKKSAERITTLVVDIHNATNATVMATEDGTKTVEQGTYLTQTTVEVFNGLAASITSVFESAQQTLLNVKQQVAAVRQVVEAMNALKHGAMETATGTTQTKRMIAHLTEIAQTLSATV
jgi:methyl-accepting chemotaxis protein